MVKYVRTSAVHDDLRGEGRNLEIGEIERRKETKEERRSRNRSNPRVKKKRNDRRGAGQLSTD